VLRLQAAFGTGTQFQGDMQLSSFKLPLKSLNKFTEESLHGKTLHIGASSTFANKLFSANRESIY
jgi:hypothetical protein